MTYPYEISRKVLEDTSRPCLYGVRGPCYHPDCLESHYQTKKAELEKVNVK